MNATVDDVNKAFKQVVETQFRIRQLRSVDSIIDSLAKTADHWLEPNNSWRLRAINEAPFSTGFSPAMVAEAINITFSAITPSALQDMLEREFGDRHVLDELRPTVRGRTVAIGPITIAHFLAGNVPSPGIVSICCGLLLKSGNIVKASSRDPVFPRLFVESLRQVDPELADAVVILNWDRDDIAVTKAMLSDAVIAYGDDESVRLLHTMMGTTPGVRFLEHGHKFSLGLITQEVLKPETIQTVSDAAAFDVSIYDQQGCMSPQMFYVEYGGAISPREFANELALAMARYQHRVPRGRLSVEEAASIAILRADYEFRAASDPHVACWAHSASNEWVVIYDEYLEPRGSCLNRVIYVKPVENIEYEIRTINGFQRNLSTIGLAPISEKITNMIQRFPWTEPPRICEVGQMQRPSLTTYHDGRPRIADLVRWMDVE